MFHLLAFWAALERKFLCVLSPGRSFLNGLSQYLRPKFLTHFYKHGPLSEEIVAVSLCRFLFIAERRDSHMGSICKALQATGWWYNRGKKVLF